MTLRTLVEVSVMSNGIPKRRPRMLFCSSTGSGSVQGPESARMTEPKEAAVPSSVPLCVSKA